MDKNIKNTYEPKEENKTKLKLFLSQSETLNQNKKND